MTCSLCGSRKARRSCPALGRDICPICCGTRRLVDIPCPPDCSWLAGAREHPAAVVVRRQQQDIGRLVHGMRDLGERQSRLFFMVTTFLARYEPGDLQSVIDDDVAEAMGALAGTFEAASRGVIYEQRPASLPAERLLVALKPLVLEAGRVGGSSFERDAAVVLRRVEEAARETHAADARNRRAFLELVGRVIPKTGPLPGAGEDKGAGGIIEVS